MDLQNGDEVRLKSGGPTMVIDDIGEYLFKKKALCSWFVTGKRMTDTFELHSLEKVVKAQPRVLHVRTGRI